MQGTTLGTEPGSFGGLGFRCVGLGRVPEFRSLEGFRKQEKISDILFGERYS